MPLSHKHDLHLHHVSLRVKDPKVSMAFYERNFGMRLAHSYHFNEMNFSLYFMERSRHDVKGLPEANGSSSEAHIWNLNEGSLLELTHNHGTEEQVDFCVNNGNEEPYRGFGHIAFNTPDLNAAVQGLLENGVKFRKLPNEGRMKHIAVALDPDGYWIEILERGAEPDTFHRTPDLVPAHKEDKFNFSQIMLRIKSPMESLRFYQDVLGMTLVKILHLEGFSLYFLASFSQSELRHLPSPLGRNSESCKNGLPKNLPAEMLNSSPKECDTFVHNLWRPVLELTHNHGTENQVEFKYHDGNTEPKGFGHIAFTCQDIERTVKDISTDCPDVVIKKKPEDGKMTNIAFLLDPDGYMVELVPRNFTPQFKEM